MSLAIDARLADEVTRLQNAHYLALRSVAFALHRRTQRKKIKALQTKANRLNGSLRIARDLYIAWQQAEIKRLRRDHALCKNADDRIKLEQMICAKEQALRNITM